MSRPTVNTWGIFWGGLFLLLIVVWIIKYKAAAKLLEASQTLQQQNGQ